ncbi:hypothetical protein PSTT_10682 [Puccinia striiformis]|uniref:Uncharacterized protein n=1 Tax=Puccinia striiformis TaxID=27350 RepID=A0A2S4V396_9BASI|nr:hypothetical protein PSTT_10682 [Puccinia striiformis]
MCGWCTDLDSQWIVRILQVDPPERVQDKYIGSNLWLSMRLFWCSLLWSQS